jgi:hypothetical protein
MGDSWIAWTRTTHLSLAVKPGHALGVVKTVYASEAAAMATPKIVTISSTSDIVTSGIVTGASHMTPNVPVQARAASCASLAIEG